MPTRYLPFSYIVHLHAEHGISDSQEGATTAAKGGGKLKGKEWSSPISNKSLPESGQSAQRTRRVNRPLPLAAEKPLRAEGLC